MTEYCTRDFQLLFGFNNQEVEMRLIDVRARVRQGLIHDRLRDDEYLRWYSRRQVAMYQYLRWARDRGLT